MVLWTAAALLAGTLVSGGSSGAATAKKTAPKAAATPPRASGTVAAVGTSRTVDQVDIQRAAQSLDQDPLRVKDPARWRRSLLDRSVDRELLAMEAERQGLDRDSAVSRLVFNREYSVFQREIYRRVLIPQLKPTDEDLERAYAGRMYRAVDLSVILFRTDVNPGERAMAQRIAAAARAGAKFDSLAKIYSDHPPTKSKGGRIGWVLTRDVNPAWYEDAKKASPGDVLGPYRGPIGDEVYKIAAFQELSRDSLSRLIYQDRSVVIWSDYEGKILAKYHFAIDSTQIKSLLFAVASESPDSILRSLRPDGTRDKIGARPAIGILARYDGGTVTFPDLMDAAPVTRSQIGGLHVDTADEFRAICGRAVIQELLARDARDRGIDKDPAVARELRLLGEEARTAALVDRHVPNPDGAAVRAYFDAHPELFKRPRSWRVKVVTFANAESASVNARAWRGSGLPDSAFAARNDVHDAKGGTPWTVSAGQYATARYTTLTLFEGDDDPLTRAIAGAPVGAIVGPIALPYGGTSVMQVLSMEEAHPATFEEGKVLAHRLKRYEEQSRWVDATLKRLRASTPVRVLPGRLESTKLVSHRPTTRTGGVSQ